MHHIAILLLVLNLRYLVQGKLRHADAGTSTATLRHADSETSTAKIMDAIADPTAAVIDLTHDAAISDEKLKVLQQILNNLEQDNTVQPVFWVTNDSVDSLNGESANITLQDQLQLLNVSHTNTLDDKTYTKDRLLELDQYESDPIIRSLYNNLFIMPKTGAKEQETTDTNNQINKFDNMHKFIIAVHNPETYNWILSYLPFDMPKIPKDFQLPLKFQKNILNYSKSALRFLLKKGTVMTALNETDNFIKDYQTSKINVYVTLALDTAQDLYKHNVYKNLSNRFEHLPSNKLNDVSM